MKDKKQNEIPYLPNGEIDYKKYLESKSCDFLKKDKHLGSKICLLAPGGSRAYGTATPESDIDLRGIAINSIEEIFGLEPDFECVEDTVADTVVYSFRKIIKLLISCNPNTIEILGLEPDQYLYVDEIGKMIIENKTAFLSRQAIQSFGGYAAAQYNRLEHNLLRNGENDDRKLLMIKKSMENSITSLNKMNPKHIINMKVSLQPNIAAVVLSGEFDKVPADTLKDMISAIHSIQKDYGNINKRNTKKDEFHLNKHMMHLIRLYLMGIDLNTTGQIITFRKNEHDMLMSIRNGEYTLDDGAHVRKEFFEILHDIQNRYMYSVEHTVLPEEYDKVRVHDLVIDANSKILLKYQHK